MKVTMGIDPGLSGGIVYDLGQEPIIINMPNEEGLISLFHSLNYHDVRVFIEHQHSFPGQGVSSTFKLGKHYGFLLGVLKALNIEHDIVTASTWMKHFSLKKDKKESKHKWKSRIKELAKKMYPKAKITLKTSDAVFIYEYGKWF